MTAPLPYSPALPDLARTAGRAARRSAGAPPKRFVDPLLVALCGAGLAFGAELTALDALPNVRVRTLIGPRTQHPIDAASLAPSIRDPRSIDVYACGPEALLDSVRTAARALGVPADRVHIESFDM